MNKPATIVYQIATIVITEQLKTPGEPGDTI